MALGLYLSVDTEVMPPQGVYVIASLGDKNARPTISVVVPCYNEVECLRELYQRLTSACYEIVGNNYEIVLVNDGSRDATWESIVSLALSDPQIVGLNLSRNYGHQVALTAGLERCRGDRILILDADLQDPPELLGDMMKLMDQGADIVYGQRSTRTGETFFKKASASFFYRLLQNLTDVDIPVDTGDFRLMNKRALDALLTMPERHRFIRGMVSWIGFDQVPFIYQRDERHAGKTKYPLKKMLSFAFDAITGFSIRPLRLATLSGLIIAIPALPLLGYALHSWIAGDTIPGWTSLMAVVLVLGSAQMLLIGVIGEYLGRLYMESKGRPLYIVKDTIDTDKGSKSV